MDYIVNTFTYELEHGDKVKYISQIQFHKK